MVEVIGVILRRTEPDTTSPFVALQILAGCVGALIGGGLAWAGITTLLLNFELDPTTLWWIVWGTTVLVGLISGILLAVYLVLCLLVTLISIVGLFFYFGFSDNLSGYATLNKDIKTYSKVNGSEIGKISSGTTLKLRAIHTKKYTTWFDAWQLVDSTPRTVIFTVPEKLSSVGNNSVFNKDTVHAIWNTFDSLIARKNKRAENKIVTKFIVSITPMIHSTTDNVEKEAIEVDKSKKILYRGFQGSFKSDKKYTIYYCNASDYSKLRKLDAACTKEVKKSRINPYKI